MRCAMRITCAHARTNATTNTQTSVKSEKRSARKVAPKIGENRVSDYTIARNSLHTTQHNTTHDPPTIQSNNTIAHRSPRRAAPPPVAPPFTSKQSRGSHQAAAKSALCSCVNSASSCRARAATADRNGKLMKFGNHIWWREWKTSRVGEALCRVVKIQPSQQRRSCATCDR